MQYKKNKKVFYLIWCLIILATLSVVALFICGINKIINPTSIEWMIICAILFILLFLLFCCWCVWDSFYHEPRREKNGKWE